MATDPGKPFWAHAGRKPTFSNPNVGEFSAGDDAMGDSTVMNPNNNDRASRIPDRKPVKEAFHRARMPYGEAITARLSISPSDKRPTNSAQASLAGSTKLVRSTGSRSRRNFGSGQSDAS